MKFISNTSDNSPEFLNFAWNMSQKKHITFIINPISGGHEKEDIVELIKNDLDTTLFDAEIRMTEYAGHAMEIARECVKKGVDIVAAVGGDGTINEVARTLTHTQTALAIIPCGSGNGLARHLCIPMNPRKAIQIINQCQIETLTMVSSTAFPFSAPAAWASTRSSR